MRSKNQPKGAKGPVTGTGVVAKAEAAPSTPKVAAVATAPQPAPGPSAKQVVSVGERTFLRVPVAALSAALVTAPKKDEKFPYRVGVFLHRAPNGDVRLATIGEGMLCVQTLRIDPKEAAVCAWLGEGLLLPRDVVERATRALPGDVACIGFGLDNPSFLITDSIESVTFRAHPVGLPFPDYEKAFEAAARALVTKERLPDDMTVFASAHYQHATRIAKALEAEDIVTFPGEKGEKDLGIIAFPSRPGVLLLVGHVDTGAPALPAATARILGDRALKGTIAALRAHETRHRLAAKQAKDPKSKEAELKIADEKAKRIAELLGCTQAALPAPQKTEPPKTVTKSANGAKPADVTAAKVPALARDAKQEKVVTKH